jgi:phosphogluconate dehydratase
MPELHKLVPGLSALQSHGRRVAIVTDGRMSGASGKVPAAIHLTPEALCGGAIARVRDGDMIRLDADGGTLDVLVDAATLQQRTPVLPDTTASDHGVGRELFVALRRQVSSADHGASLLHL